MDSFETSTCYPSLREMENINLNSGRFINDLDLLEFRKVVVIGDEIRKALFKEEDPIGKYVRIGGVPFNVIGVTRDKKRAEKNRSGVHAIHYGPTDLQTAETGYTCLR